MAHHCVEAKRSVLHILMCLHVLQQIQAEFIEAKVHDGYAIVHLLDIHHFLLQLLQLGLAVFQIAFLFRRDGVVVTG